MEQRLLKERASQSRRQNIPRSQSCLSKKESSSLSLPCYLFYLSLVQVQSPARINSKTLELSTRKVQKSVDLGPALTFQRAQWTPKWTSKRASSKNKTTNHSVLFTNLSQQMRPLKRRSRSSCQSLPRQRTKSSKSPSIRMANGSQCPQRKVPMG